MALQLMTERLERHQTRWFVIKPKQEKSATISQDERRAGYAFIRSGPRSNGHNEFIEWADEHVHDEGGPIYGWPEAKVVSALNNYLQGRQNAKVLTGNAVDRCVRVQTLVLENQ